MKMTEVYAAARQPDAASISSDSGAGWPESRTARAISRDSPSQHMCSRTKIHHDRVSRAPSRRSSRDGRADIAQQGLRRRAPRARPRVRGRPGVAPGAHPSASTRRSAACGAASRGAAQGRWSCRGSASEETRRVRGSKGADATRGGVGRRPPALLARSPATPPTTRSERLARWASSAKF